MTPKRYREQEMRGVRSVDPDTGEVTELGDLTGFVPQIPTRAKTRREVRFVMVQIGSRTARSLSELRMSGTQWRVFWAVMDRMILESGECRVRTVELAGILGYTPRFTSRALGSLSRRGILIRKRVGVWTVNPLLAGNGSVEGWALRMEDAPPIDWEGS